MRIEELVKLKKQVNDLYFIVKKHRENEQVQEELDVLQDLENSLNDYIIELEALEKDKLKCNFGLKP